MRICIALHQVMDLGGIINHTEQLIGGLQDLGHTVHLKELVYADNAHSQRREGPFRVGPSGIPHHQGKGWNFERRQRLPYKTTAGLQAARQILNEYDLVIWTVPVPSKNAQNKGNFKWPALYDLDKPKQIAFIHDGNAVQGYPHLMYIEERLDGIACVHHAALGCSGHLTRPRALVLNPQLNPIREKHTFEEKLPGFFNMQTFKAWKHVHELIEAIAYMPKKDVIELREVVGKGIEYQYMTSEDKCKPQYFHENGAKFWDAALENGMTHHDYMDVGEVNEWLMKSRVLVDPSWSKKYSKYGGHYNRVVVDGLIRGAIPVAHRLGMGEDLFKPGEHYVDLSRARDAVDYADIVHDASRNPTLWDNINEACEPLLRMFERGRVAQKVIDLAFGDLDECKIHRGEWDLGIYNKADDILFHHFGILS